MKSMTGYGKAVVTRLNRELTVELKTVNHRFLDVSTKIPRMFIAYEDVIRNHLATGLSRGHVDVYVNYKVTDGDDKKVTVDVNLATGYVEASKQLLQQFPELHNDFNLSSLMRTPDVINIEQQEENEELVREMLCECVDNAVSQLNVMRENEGNKLRKDILTKIDVIEQLLNKVAVFAPSVAENYREKLRQRITEALGDVQLDEAKLANEVCFYSDKCSIDEEITRLRSHIDNARDILASEEPVGRKLDFLVQEFNRETNTICSKSNDIELTNVALMMKNEIEKVREQVQNLE